MASLKTTVDVYQNKTADISAYNFCGKTTNAPIENFRLSQEKRVLLEEKEALLFKGITTLTGPNGAENPPY